MPVGNGAGHGNDGACAVRGDHHHAHAIHVFVGQAGVLERDRVGHVLDGSDRLSDGGSRLVGGELRIYVVVPVELELDLVGAALVRRANARAVRLGRIPAETVGVETVELHPLAGIEIEPFAAFAFHGGPVYRMIHVQAPGARILEVPVRQLLLARVGGRYRVGRQA